MSGSERKFLTVRLRLTVKRERIIQRSAFHVTEFIPPTSAAAVTYDAMCLSFRRVNVDFSEKIFSFGHFVLLATTKKAAPARLKAPKRLRLRSVNQS